MAEPRWLIQHRRATRLGGESETIDPRAEALAELPLLGRVSAGEPLEAIEDPEPLWLPERLAAPHRFLLRVQGDSMRDELIEDGDLILIERRSSARNGETVVALIDDGLATLKRLYQEAGGIRLQPANPAYPPIERPVGAVQVLGVVLAVIRPVE
jgi:repressor LexA